MISPLVICGVMIIVPIVVVPIEEVVAPIPPISLVPALNIQQRREQKVDNVINSQSLEDTQVGYISQKYSFDKYTLGRAFKPSYALLSI